MRSRVQREGEVAHLIAEHLVDLTHLLRTVRERDKVFALAAGSGDEAPYGGGPDQWDANAALGRKARDIEIPDLRLESGIKVPAWNFS